MDETRLSDSNAEVANETAEKAQTKKVANRSDTRSTPQFRSTPRIIRLYTCTFARPHFCTPVLLSQNYKYYVSVFPFARHHVCLSVS